MDLPKSHLMESNDNSRPVTFCSYNWLTQGFAILTIILTPPTTRQYLTFRRGLGPEALPKRAHAKGALAIFLH